MNFIHFPEGKETKFALLGGGYHISIFANMLIEGGYNPPVIVTWPKEDHERDRVMLNDRNTYQYLFDIADKYGLEVIETYDINSPKVVDSLLSMGCNVALSLSWRTIIKKEFIEAFDNRVLNLHPTLLPKERGAAAYSWRILNNSKEVSSTIHIVDEELDNGNILLQIEDILECDNPKPIDFIASTNYLYKKILNQLLDIVKSGCTHKLTPQNKDNHTYLHRLYTEVNGAIDWKWSIFDIERFIRAFSDPYPGAFTFVRGQKIHILDSEIVEIKKFHPFSNGKVLSIFDDGSVNVTCSSGILKIKSVSFIGDTIKEGVNPNSFFRYSDTLHTPDDVLENSITSNFSPKQMQ